jgi:TonB-dependent starch-binding outer membrane protein SusC
MKKICEILLLLFCAFPLFAQNSGVRTIKGTVTDKATGEFLAGVSVIVPGTTIGFLTDINGNYSINVPARDSVLQFSFVGYTTKVVDIKNQIQVNVNLSEDTKVLDEVVVVGYGTQKRSDLTGSISTVNVNEVGKRAVVSVTQALQGQVAGVDITSNSGTPGAGVMIRVRGIGTINDSDPLYVVDGMMVGDIDFINSSDIESIQVLKDASATAIYGSRGANGVVIVTTKKGSNGDAKVTFSSYYGIQNAWRSSNMMDGPTWSYLRNEALIAAGSAPAIADPASESTTNWFKEISNANAPISNVDVSVSGGNEKGNYFMSINRFSQDGIIKKTDFDRLSFRSNASYNVKPWLTVGDNLTVLKSNSQAQYESDEWTSMMITSFMRDPVTPVKNADGSYTKSIYTDTNNPVATIEYTNNTYLDYRTLGDMFANISLLKNLIFKTDYSFQYSYGDGRDYVPVYSVFSMQQNTVSKLYESYDKGYTQQWTNTLNYEKKFGDHNVSVLLGAESYTEKYKSSSITVNNFTTDDPDAIIIDNAIGRKSAYVTGSLSEAKQLSAMARLNYSFKGKYLFTSNFRADGSSKFIRGKRWDYFPSFSLGWKISEEPFMKSIPVINELKLRAGWGQIGNQGSVGAYEYLTSASSGADYIWGGAWRSGFCFPGVGNTELKWEISTTSNVGLDFSLYNDKLTGSIEYYVKNTTGMILAVQVPGQSGVQNPPYQNAGSMKNNGLELSLQYRNMGHAFTYTFGGNFSKINNKVVSLGTESGAIYGALFMDQVYLTKTIAGKPIDMFYGYKTEGLFQNQAEIDAQTAQTNVSPGDVRYVDADKDGLLDVKYLGSPLPKFTYSFNASCAYKGFDISINFQGVYGNKLYNGPSTYTRSSVGLYNLSRDMIHRWTGEGTQNSARYPRMCSSDVNNETLNTDRFIEDGSYLRVKTCQIGYELNKSLLDKVSIAKMRIYLNAQNLFTFTKYSGMDPEIGMRDSYDIGIDRGTYPQARTYSLGLDVTF